MAASTAVVVVYENARYVQRERNCFVFKFFFYQNRPVVTPTPYSYEYVRTCRIFPTEESATYTYNSRGLHITQLVNMSANTFIYRSHS